MSIKLENMKKTVKKVQEILNSAQWTADWCHPDRWDESEYNKCIDTLDSAHFGADLVGEYLDLWLPEILEEYKSEEVDFYQLCAKWIADPIATQKLKNCNYPDSATFILVRVD